MSVVSVTNAGVLADLWLPRRLSWVKEMGVLLGAALLLTALAQLAIPLPGTPVPLTGQTLGILLCGMILGARRGTSSVLLYLMLGAVGLPVFAATGSGAAHFVGPTGGYLFAFPFAAYLVGLMCERGGDRTLLRAAGTMTLGVLLILTLGTMWLSLFVGGLENAVLRGIVPFVPGEIVKIAFVACVLPTLHRAFLSRRPSPLAEK